MPLAMVCDACAASLGGIAANVQLAQGEFVVMSFGQARLRPTHPTQDYLLCATCATCVVAGIRHLIASRGADAREQFEPEAAAEAPRIARSA